VGYRRGGGGMDLFRGGMDLFRGGYERVWVGRPFSGQGVGGGTPFSARRKKILTFQVILGTYVAIAQNSLLGSF
jgi:hypothetical protein